MIIGTILASLTFGAAYAFADNFAGDSDVLTADVQNNPITVNLAPGGTANPGVGVEIKAVGTNHVTFPVSVGVTTSNTSGTTVGSAADSSLSITAFDDVGEAKSTVHVTAPAAADLTCGVTNSFAGKVTFTSSAANLNPNSTSVNITVNVQGPDCFPADTTAPGVTFSTSPADGNNGWFVTSPVTLTVHASDVDDNVSSIDCTVDGNVVSLTNTSGIGSSATATGDVVFSVDGDHDVSCTATDSDGNTTDPAASTEVKLDATDPTVAITTPPDGASYVLNEVVNAEYNCSDPTPGSGLLSCVGDEADGNPIDTSTVGPHSFTVNAEDNAGNTSSATNTYTVRYAICLLYDDAKLHKAGSTVPIRFFLCDANGDDVSSSGITVQATSLHRQDGQNASTPEDSGHANSPDNNFRFDDTLGPSGGYIFNLSTKSPSPALGSTTSLGTGTWVLDFKVDGVSGYSVHFVVR
jgi:hypothetical protein